MAIAERPKERLRGCWICFHCNQKYPNTMRWCPKCNIAKKHSDNLNDNMIQKQLRGVDRI